MEVAAVDRPRSPPRYEQWNQAVQDYVSAARLLVWEVKDGWEPLYRFLGIAMPDVPFPHLNDREAFQMLMHLAHEYGTP